MKKYTSISVLLFCAIIGTVFQACSTGGLEKSALAMPAIQYGTIKLIQESDGVTAADVRDFVGTVRAIVNEDSQVDVTALFTEVRKLVDFTQLDAADEVLVNALLCQAQDFVDGIDLLDEARLVAIGTILGWVEEAAKMVPADA